MSDLSIDIESNDENKTIPVETTNKDNNNKPHNGKPITEIEISPNGNYLVTYSGIVYDKEYKWIEGDYSFVGWNVENIDEGQLKPDNVCNIEKDHGVFQICVSDDKKLAYIYYNYLRIIDMNNNNQEINLYFDKDIYPGYCTFNLKGEFILYSTIKYKGTGIIWIYSTTKNNKWNCKKIYKLPGYYDDGFILISISKYDKLYLFSYLNNSIYEWDILTEKSIRIFGNEEIKTLCDKMIRDYEFRNRIRISSNGKFICLKTEDKIIIYSIESETLIVSLNNNDIQLYNFMNDLDSDLYYLLLTSFGNRQISHIHNDNKRITSNEIMEHCWKECSPKEYQTGNLPILFDNTSKFVFGILDGHLWKIKLDEKINFSFENSDELNNKNDKIMEENSNELNENDKIIEENSDELNENDKIIESWNIYLDNGIPINKSFENSDENDEIIESWNIYLDNECDDHLNIHLFSPYMDTIHNLFQEIISADKRFNDYGKELELPQDLIKIKVNIDKVNDKKIQLLVQISKKNNVNNEWDLICEKSDNYDSDEYLSDKVYGIKLCNDNDFVVLSEIGLLIYHFNESSKSISLNYFYYIDLVLYHGKKSKKTKTLQDYEKVFSKFTLPLPNDDSFKSDSWVSSIIDNKLRLLKYGVELLSFAIKEHKLELVDDIYKKCINYFKQDLLNNRMFLSIITSTMPILDEYYPEYILRYSLETTMIVDSPFYSIEHKNNEHLYSFPQYPQIVNLSRSILWTKYAYLLNEFPYNNLRTFMIPLILIQLLIFFLTFIPICFIYFPTFYILSKFHFINEICRGDAFSQSYFYIFDKISSKFSKHTTTPTITFMIPYIKFVNYPQDYNRNWFWELIRPQSSPFVKTINRDIYKTWSGEALINFKWNTYGKYYYAIIWIIFMALFGCFTTAATITLVEDVRNKLLIASIIFGFIHLLTEVRQIIYNPKKWVRDLWNIFDIIAYMFPICTSIYWLRTNNMITWLLSFSCLFLDIKFLMFFRAFESFGVYFAIIISVGTQIISFLVVLLIIIMSFAHAFYILLLPRSDNDPNSPSNLATTYNKVFDNGTIDNSNSFMIQSPDDNTNMFVDYRTSILAMYLFLTGDSNSLTNWSYTKNPPLVILIVSFSFLVVVYLMNLFIGLLNIAIERDNNRVSYLIEKAKILAEIELFYLFPHQRRWQEWFPDTIYYYASADKTRDKIKEMISNGEWNTDEFPELKEDLLNKLNLKHNHDKLMKIIEEIATKM